MAKKLITGTASLTSDFLVNMTAAFFFSWIAFFPLWGLTVLFRIPIDLVNLYWFSWLMFGVFMFSYNVYRKGRRAVRG